MALLTCKEYLAKCEGFDPIFDKMTGPLITIPDEALTIIEIIQRYSRGIPLPIRQPLFDEEAELMDEGDDLQLLSDVRDQQAYLEEQARRGVDVPSSLSEPEKGSEELKASKATSRTEEV